MTNDQELEKEWISRKEALELLKWQDNTFRVACANFRRYSVLNEKKIGNVRYYLKSDILKMKPKKDKA